MEGLTQLGQKVALRIICMILGVLSLLPPNELSAQDYSAARVWNEMVLNAIRNDFARPTVHARNLHHTSIAMYDAFAAYDEINEPYFLGKTVNGFTCPFDGVPIVGKIDEARKTAMSYAVYRLIRHRFQDAPFAEEIFFNTDLVFSAFGYDNDYVDTDYSTGNPAALGNYIAEQLIEYGMQDGSNEENKYENKYYKPINPEINPFSEYFSSTLGFGNERLSDPNRWQQISIPGLTDQAGNVIPGGTLPFLSAEWGEVGPFALAESDGEVLVRDSNEYIVYHNPGPPHLLDTLQSTPSSEEYRWGFSLVAHWKSHTIFDSVFYNISPSALGNIEKLPENDAEYKSFYNFMDGGDASRGHEMNPHTGLPYEDQFVFRSDYTRVVAEFWADGPSSETPPGHWFTILNYVNDQEDLVKKYKGTSIEMTDLEWDVKAYFVLGGAMHDAAISAWSNKGYYDYIRPLSAIRYMVDQGQSTDPSLPNYSMNGMPLIPGSIEQILDNDPLLAFDSSNYGAIKILGNRFEDQNFYISGSFWNPYQPRNFITPPFAGYVSGHSTFSRAAAEVLTRFTGDEYFPGGIGEYEIPAMEYLETNPGPSDSLTLQWATYRDAAHQSALSRIWGGIHPPIDDIPGRKIGIKVGNDAFDLADSLFGQPVSSVHQITSNTDDISVFPNPLNCKGTFQVKCDRSHTISKVELFNLDGIKIISLNQTSYSNEVKVDLARYTVNAGIYTVKVHLNNGATNSKSIILLN